MTRAINYESDEYLMIEYRDILMLIGRYCKYETIIYLLEK